MLGALYSYVTLYSQVSLDTSQIVWGELIPRLVVHTDIRLETEAQGAARDWPSKLRGSNVAGDSQWLSALIAWHLAPTEEQGTPTTSC